MDLDGRGPAAMYGRVMRGLYSGVPRSRAKMAPFGACSSASGGLRPLHSPDPSSSLEATQLATTRALTNRTAGDMSTRTPHEVLGTIVEGINSGNLDMLMPLYEPNAAFATQPGILSHGLRGVGEALGGFIAMKGKLDLRVTRVLEVNDLALVTTVWSFTGTGPDGKPVKLAAKSADVLRRQADGSWRFVIDNPWGTD